jgi:hypothetical protein
VRSLNKGLISYGPGFGSEIFFVSSFMRENISNWGAETFFLIFAFWWPVTPLLMSQHLTAGNIEYPAYILALVLILQFYLKSRIIGLIVSALLTLYFAYLILALLSDFADSGSIVFIVRGGALIVVSITMTIVMFWKYYRERSR